MHYRGKAHFDRLNAGFIGSVNPVSAFTRVHH